MALDLTYDPNFGGDSDGVDLTYDPAYQPKKQNKGLSGDLGTDLKRGIMGIPGAVTGLVDIPVAAATGEAAIGKGWDRIGKATGFRPSLWAKEAEAEYSPARQEANRMKEAAWEDGTAMDIAGAYLKNPGHNILGPIVESAPSMVAGGVAARGIGLAAKVAPAIAGGIGEGAIMAGQAMNNLVGQGVDARTAAGYSASTGIAGGAMGAVGGKVAQKFGVIDPDTALAGGAARAASEATGMAALKETGKRMIGGGISEGVFEELPQSVMEQGFSNLAQDKPATEGMARAGVEGAQAGFGMGAAFNALPSSKYIESKRAPAEDKPEIAGLLPAPTYTGTPGDQTLQFEADRQNSVDAAQANADQLYAERAAYEEAMQALYPSGLPTLTTDPAPLQQRIDAMLRINEQDLKGLRRTKYQRDLTAAFNEVVGITHDADGREIPLTMGALLDSQATAEAESKRVVATRNAEQQASARAQQLADEEMQPAIPVVGPLSAIANAAVQSGVTAQVQMQRAAVEQAKAKPAGPLSEIAAQSEQSNGPIATQAASQVATPGAQVASGELPGSGSVQSSALAGDQGRGSNSAEVAAPGMRPDVSTGIAGDQAAALNPITGGQSDAPQFAQTQTQAVQTNDAPAGPAPVAAPAAIVEIARRSSASNATEQRAAAGLPASTAWESRPAPVASNVDSQLKQSRAKPIEKWTAEEIKARLARDASGESPLFPENRSKFEQLLAPLVQAKAAEDAKKAAQAERIKKMQAAKQANKNTFLVGVDKDNAERISVRNGVVYMGEYPAADLETEADIMVPEGATQQQIFDALIAGQAVTKSAKIFGKNGPEQSVADRIAQLEAERAAMSPAEQNAAAAIESAMDAVAAASEQRGIEQSEESTLSYIGASNEEIEQSRPAADEDAWTERQDQGGSASVDAGAKEQAGGRNQERDGNATGQAAVATEPAETAGAVDRSQWSISPYRYAKDSIVLKITEPDGYKGRLGRIVSAIGGRYVGRAGGYVMSEAKARKALKLAGEGYDGSIIDNKLEAPKAAEQAPADLPKNPQKTDTLPEPVKEMAKNEQVDPVEDGKPANKADDVKYNIADDAPWYYSPLAKAFETAKQGAMPAGMWKSWLASNAAKLGVKQDEIQWSGINDWLEMRGKEKTAKADILAYLDSNGVKVEEVMKSDGDWAVYDGEDNQYFSSRKEAEDYASDMGINITEDTVFRGTDRPGGYGTKYETYVLPGGENYRELLLTLPVKTTTTFKVDRRDGKWAVVDDHGNKVDQFFDEGSAHTLAASLRMESSNKTNFTSAHWDEKNILAHVRFNDRTDAEGNKVLFIEELQSDWGQAGKKKGFSVGTATREDHLRFMALDAKTFEQMSGAERIEYDKLLVKIERDGAGIPTSPFVTDTKAWLSLGLKRMIAYAVENGYDKVAFVNGEQSAERYDLSKQIRRVEYLPEKRELTAYGLDGNAVLEKTVAPENIEDYVGKEVAKKLLESEPITTGSGKKKHSISGDGLKVGGEGMKTFYNQIVPQVANDVLRKLGGGKVETVSIGKTFDQYISGRGIELRDGKMFVRGLEMNGSSVRRQYQDDFPDGQLSQSGFTITDAMREKSAGGLPLFSKNGPSKLSTADKAIYGMAAEGKSAGEILKFIAAASRNPFYRQLAKLLQKTGINPTITVGDGKNWKFNAGEGNKYAAGYSPKTDTIAFFRPASAERNALHELVHAASLKALSGKGMAAAQMNALYKHVKASGKLKGMYGMSDVDEFIAEAFSNPQFQKRLKAVAAPARSGGTLSSAWNWFVRIIRGILGVSHNQENALAHALEIGVDVMRENMRLSDAPKNGNVRGMADKDTVAGTQAPTSSGDGSTERVVDVSGNGNRVQYFNDKKGTFVESQKYPTGKVKWRAGEVVDGFNQWFSSDEFDSKDAAEKSIRGYKAKERIAKKYGSIPSLWRGEEKKFAKALIDAGFSIDRFSSSTQSKSKYIYLENGLKIRLADHSLPLHYDSPDFDFRYGDNIKALIDEIKNISEGAPAPNDANILNQQAPTSAGDGSTGGGNVTAVDWIAELVRGKSFESAKRAIVAQVGSVGSREKFDDDVADSVFMRLQSVSQVGRYTDASGLAYRNARRLAGDGVITLYRASPKGSGIRPGDFATETAHEAGFYKHGKNVIQKSLVPRKDVIAVDGSSGGGQEYVYLPEGYVPPSPNEQFKSFREFFDFVAKNEPSASAGSDAIRYAQGDKRSKQTDTEAFRKWFGASKVVDSSGAPLVVYHGTNADVSKFERRSSTTKAYYFAADQKMASEYTNGQDGGNVMPVYLSLKNPMEVDAKGAAFASIDFVGARTNERALVRKAQADGFDGLVLRNVLDGAGPYGETVPTDVFVAFRPEQIKSAIGNNGDFDATNPDIRYNVADEGWSVSEPSKMDDLIYSLQDKQIDLKRVMQSIMQTGKKVKDEINAYLQEELFHGRAAKGVKDFLDFELRPLLKQMQEAKVDMGDFEEYLWNRHAEERNKQIAKINPEMPDGGSGIETAAARAYLAVLGAEQKRVFESMAAKVEAINKNSQRVLVESGLEKQSTIDAWNGAYQHYVPLQREDVDNGHVGTGKGFSVRGSSTKRAMGSGKAVVDIIANLTMQRERNIVRAEKNRVSNALLGLAVQNPNPEFWKVDQAPKERVVEETAIYTVLDADGKKIEEFTRMSEAERLANKTPGSTIDQSWGDRVNERITPGFKSRDNVILTRINGEDHYIIFNERDDRAMRLSSSMKNLDMDNMGRALSIVGKATRYLASVNTQYNPVFGVINLVRDVQGALLNLQSTQLAGEQKRVAGYTVDALRGIYADIRAHRRGEKPSSKWATLFEEFQKEGGQTGYRDQYANAEARAEAIVSELGQFKEGKPKQLARAVFGWLSDYNETMENAVRLAAYKTAKENGLSNQQAASIAKNLTVNFNRKGSATTQIGALYAFFNASVQGTARMAETLFEANDGDAKKIRLSKLGKKILAGGIMLGSMQALILAAAGFDDDEPPEFIRERNLILPIGDGKYLTLAMPLGFHVIPGIGRIATEFALSGFKDPAKRTVSLLGMFAETFNPVGSSGFSIQTLTPSVVDPFAALAENRDFTGREIYRDNFNANDPSPGHARAKDVATIWSRYISESINFITGGTDFKPGAFSPSPDAIDYLIAQVGGGVMREANKVGQTAGAAYTGDELPLYKVPLVGRFVGDTEGQSGHSQKFYNAVREINLHEREIKGLRESGRADEARAYLAENPVYRMAMLANRTESQVRKLRDVRRAASESGDADKVSAINEQITGLMTRFNERAAPLLEQ